MARVTRRGLLLSAPLAMALGGLARAEEAYRAQITARSWAVADAATGEVLGAHELDTPRKSASITKVMTALLVAEHAAAYPDVLNETVVFSAAAVGKGGTRTGLKAGESLSVLDALYGLLLPSGNDAGWALAEHFGDRFGGEGDDAVRRFVSAMNRKAGELGMAATTYRIPFGDGGTAADRTTTAADLLTLARAAMAQPLVATIVGTGFHATVATGADGRSRYVSWVNKNRMLAEPGATGIKTGTTSAAGACLLTEIVVGGRKVHIVVLGSRDDEQRYVDTRLIMGWLASRAPV